MSLILEFQDAMSTSSFESQTIVSCKVVVGLGDVLIWLDDAMKAQQ